MPEDDPSIFAKVLEFIYFSKTPFRLSDDFMKELDGDKDQTPSQATTRHDAQTGMIGAYCLAEKLCMEPLMNCIHDHYRVPHERFSVRISELNDMTENGRRDSLLKLFAFKQLVFYVKLKTWDALNMLTELKEYMEKDSQNVIELFELYTKMDVKLGKTDPAV